MRTAGWIGAAAIAVSAPAYAQSVAVDAPAGRAAMRPPRSRSRWLEIVITDPRLATAGGVYQGQLSASRALSASPARRRARYRSWQRSWRCPRCKTPAAHRARRSKAPTPCGTSRSRKLRRPKLSSSGASARFRWPTIRPGRNNRRRAVDLRRRGRDEEDRFQRFRPSRRLISAVGATSCHPRDRGFRASPARPSPRRPVFRGLAPS